MPHDVEARYPAARQVMSDAEKIAAMGRHWPAGLDQMALGGAWPDCEGVASAG